MPAVSRKILLLWMMLVVAAAGCGRPLHKESRFLMGTLVEVTSEDPRAHKIIFQEFKKIESIVNLFDPKSELSLLNKSGDLSVSPELFEVLQAAEKFYGLTDGAFDVTIGPVSILWKKAVRTSQMPSKEEVSSALGEVGFGNIYLNAETRQVKFLKMGTKIDLGGIAEGFALDRSVAQLKAAGISSALINAGGDMYCLGQLRGRPWQVAIQDPRVLKKLVVKIELADRALATSGDYEQFFIFENKRYSHIINPKTGYPADTGIVSATVNAPDALTADVLSTSLIVLGRQKGAELLKKFRGVSAKLIDTDGKIHDI